MKALGFRALPLVLAVAAPALPGCAHHQPSARELFDAIQVGMPCSEVEARLGPPVRRYSTVLPPRIGGDEAWYLPAPALEPWEYPWGFGTICVEYTIDDVVASKKLNPQWKER